MDMEDDGVNGRMPEMEEDCDEVGFREHNLGDEGRDQPA